MEQNVEAQQTPPSIDGEWRVAGIDGSDFNEPYGIALSIDPHAIVWGPPCAQQGRAYSIETGRIAFRRIDYPPVPPCDAEVPPRLGEVWQALDAADTVVRTPENGIRFSGGGQSLLIFSQ